MPKALTLSSIEKNPNVLYTHTQWLEKTLIKSCEIYKDFIFTIENNPDKFKIRKLLSIMNFTHKLGDIMVQDIQKTMDTANNLSDLLKASKSGENVSTDDILKVFFPNQVNETAQLDYIEKGVLFIKGLAEHEAKLQLIQNSGDIKESELLLEYEKKLFSEKIIDQILTSNLAMDDKKMFLDKLIKTTKETLETFAAFIGEAKEFSNNIKLQKGEETTNTFDQLAPVSEIINEQHALLTLLLKKKEQLEQQA